MHVDLTKKGGRVWREQALGSPEDKSQMERLSSDREVKKQRLGGGGLPRSLPLVRWTGRSSSWRRFRDKMSKGRVRFSVQVYFRWEKFEHGSLLMGRSQ